MSDPEQGFPGILSDAARDLCDIRSYVYAGMGAFIFGIVAGLLFPERFVQIMQSFRDFVQSFKGRNPAALILLIFLKNSSSALLSVFLGAVFGIVPLLAAAVNGILVGLVFSSRSGKSIADIILLLAPHGVFELPAIFISWGAGIWLGSWWTKEPPFKERLKRAIRIFFMIVVPLLVIAAIIEGLSIRGAV